MEKKMGYWYSRKIYLGLLWTGLGLWFLLSPSWTAGVLFVLLALYGFIRESELQKCERQEIAPPVSLGSSRLPAGMPEKIAGQEAPLVVPSSSDPAIAFIQIDNLSDVMQGLEENQRNAVMAEAHQRLMAWSLRLNGFLKKYAEDTYMGVFSRSDIDRMLEEKFDILDEIRSIRAGNKIPVTLSLGVATGKGTMTELGNKAQIGLDLALGRGGDQSAVFSSGDLQFCGGKAKVVEKSTRVKARVVAHAIRELMQEADRVLIMGHEGEDFDSLGASLGVARMARHLGKPVGIVIGEPGVSFEKLQEQLPEYKEYAGLFLDTAAAEKLVSPQTLLFILDTHRENMTAAPRLLALVPRRVVIDHHRRSEDFITNPLIVYLEPSASSTSELVTELMVYFDEKIELTRLEASALYAGIVVDTKNFAVQTGVRTFEAASYLRRAGADPVLVRHLFRVDLESLKLRAAIIAGAQILPGGVIIADCPYEVKNGQIIAAQSADTMLTIEGVRVSFVLFPAEGGVGISARSNGDVNVQVIMEQFGGGGHQTVAGAHIDGVDVPEARRRLQQVIADYIEEGEET